MEILDTGIEGLLLIQPRIFEDERGYFFEVFNQRIFEEKTGEKVYFVQDNQSLSINNVLRGLHFQKPPHAQGKLIYVPQGAVLDVAVDIRRSSPTYGKHFTVELNDKNKLMLYIPPGFAHGFHCLKDNTLFQYKCTDFYHKPSEDSILWNDPELNIDWKLEKEPVLSEKDKEAQLFEMFESPFK